MTRFRSGVTRLNCTKIWLYILAALMAALCSFFTPSKGQSQQAMVKGMPFPYPQGVAMDTVLYKNIRLKLEAAERLRLASETAISSLKQEIQDAQLALKAQKDATDEKSRAIGNLTEQIDALDTDLQTAQDSLTKAQEARNKVLAVLPRRARNSLLTASSDQIAAAVVDQIRVLQWRKWKWAGLSSLLTTVLTTVAIVTHR